MKIYRNKTNPKVIGIKFDGHWGTPKVQIEANGGLDSVLELKFVSRTGEKGFDFNSEPNFQKDYDAKLDAIFAELLGADVDDKSKNYCVKQLSLNPVAVVVTIAGDDDKISVGDIDKTIDRLINYLASATH